MGSLPSSLLQLNTTGVRPRRTFLKLSGRESDLVAVPLLFDRGWVTLGLMRRSMPTRFQASAVAGLAIALALPALATCRVGFTDSTAAIALALTPWLTLAWVAGVERRPLSSIGLRRPRWPLLPLGLAGVAVNVTITAVVMALCARAGLHETQSALMGRLLHGPGLILVLLATSGALVTEISFRAFALERLAHSTKLAAFLQVAITTAIFVAGRGWAHGLVWLVDDLAFTLYYLRSRNTPVCIAAHAIPNLFASSAVALGLAS